MITGELIALIEWPNDWTQVIWLGLDFVIQTVIIGGTHQKPPFRKKASNKTKRSHK